MCHIGTWSTRYYMRTVEKVWMSKVKKYGLSSVKKWHSAKEPLCRVSGEDTRQRIIDSCRPLTEESLCRVLSTWQTTSLPSVSCLPSALSVALGKQPLCRVPDKKHSAKCETLGKEAVSGSVCFVLLDFESAVRGCRRLYIYMANCIHYRRRLFFRVSQTLSSAFYRTLGKEAVCRVPERKHSANNWHSAKRWFVECWALGKQ